MKRIFKGARARVQPYRRDSISSKKPNRKGKVSRISEVKEWCDETSFHGPSEFLRAAWKGMKPFWILIMIAFSIICAVQIYGLLKRYFDNPIVTSALPKPVSNMTIPPMLLCLGNSISDERAKLLPAMVVAQTLSYRIAHSTSMIYDIPEMLWMRRVADVAPFADKMGYAKEYVQALPFQRCVNEQILKMLLLAEQNVEIKATMEEEFHDGDYSFESVAEAFENGVTHCSSILLKADKYIIGSMDETQARVVTRRVTLFQYVHALDPEQNAHSECFADQHICDNGQCIPMIFLCDGQFDCDDRSDEGYTVASTGETLATCSQRFKYFPAPNVCPAEMLACGFGENTNQPCFSTKQQCDGVDDCGDLDHTDELNCGTSLFLLSEDSTASRMTPANNERKKRQAETFMTDHIRSLHKNNFTSMSHHRSLNIFDVPTQPEELLKYLTWLNKASVIGRTAAQFKEPHSDQLDVIKLTRTISFPVDQVFRECRAKGRQFDCASFIRPRYDPKYGQCFLINLGDNLEQTEAGLGLSLFLRSNNRITFNSKGGSSFYPTLYDGATIRFLDKEDLSTASPDYHIPSSVMAFFTPEQTNFDRKVSESYGQCRSSMKTEVMKMEAYSNDACQLVSQAGKPLKMECYYQAILNNCSCIPPLSKDLLLLHNPITCQTSDQQKCWKRAGFNKDPKCTKQCLPACLQTSYKATISYQWFPDKEKSITLRKIPELMLYANNHNFNLPGQPKPEKGIVSIEEIVRNKLFLESLTKDYLEVEKMVITETSKHLVLNATAESGTLLWPNDVEQTKSTEISPTPATTRQTIPNITLTTAISDDPITTTETEIPNATSNLTEAANTTNYANTTPVPIATSTDPLMSSTTDNNLNPYTDELITTTESINSSLPPISTMDPYTTVANITSLPFTSTLTQNTTVSSNTSLAPSSTESSTITATICYINTTNIELINSTTASPTTNTTNGGMKRRRRRQAVKPDPETNNTTSNAEALQLMSGFANLYKMTEEVRQVKDASNHRKLQTCAWKNDNGKEAGKGGCCTEMGGCSTAGDQYLETWQEEHMLIVVAFESFLVNEVEQSLAMSWEDFLGQIGGTLGLWLGGSLMSLVHLAVFIVQFMFPNLDPDEDADEDKGKEVPNEKELYGTSLDIDMEAQAAHHDLPTVAE